MPNDAVLQSFNIAFSSIQQGSLDLVSARSQGGPRKLPFVGVVIQKNFKAKLLRYLEGSYNRTARALFPDFPGFREFGLPTGSHEPSAAIDVVESGPGSAAVTS